MISKIVFCKVCVCLSVVDAMAQKPEVWKINQSATKRLGNPVAIGTITIRPPIGFTYTKTVDRKEVTHVWVGKPITSSEPLNGFCVSTLPLSGEDKAQMEKVPITDVANLYVRNFFKSWTGAKITPWFPGTINGIPFVRAAWWATNKGGIKGRGNFYITIYKGIPYILSCVEKDAGKGTQVLYISDQAALSFCPAK